MRGKNESLAHDELLTEIRCQTRAGFGGKPAKGCTACEVPGDILVQLGHRAETSFRWRSRIQKLTYT